MKVMTGFGETWLGAVPERVRRAEEMGFDGVSTGELKHNSVLSLTLAAEHTERIELSTTTIAFPRSPMIMAQTAWDLQEFSKGRINLGLGSQVKGHNIRRFGGTWTPPARRMQEYISMMRAVWRTRRRRDRAGPRFDYTSTHDQSFRCDVGHPPPPCGAGARPEPLQVGRRARQRDLPGQPASRGGP